MLEANKSIWLEKLFAVYNRNLLKRRFNSFQVQNLQNIKNRNPNKPLIIYANHSSWWDGLVLFEILKSQEFDSYVLMEEKQLKNLKLFRRIGAFSIDRENPRKAFESINYALKILNSEKNKTLLIFPQGEIKVNDKRPISFYNGISYLIEKLNEGYLVPCSIRYEFIKDFKPDIFVKFGELELIENIKNYQRKSFTKSLEKQMTANLDFLKSAIIENDLEDFIKLF